MSYASWIKEKLLSHIKEMDQYHWLFTHDAEKDFSRIRKWSFAEIMRFIISMEGKAIKDEILEHFSFSKETPTNSSFNQRRAQILPEAFEFLFQEFNKSISPNKLYRGYRLLAFDGSDLAIANNPQDESTYYQTAPDSKGINMLHLNALYDLQVRSYADALIQPNSQKNEFLAMCSMIDRYHGSTKSIFIADRGLESYNVLAHVQEKGQFYLIRAKDLTSKNGIIPSLANKLPVDQDAFDKFLTITLTKKKTNEVKADPDKYHMLSSKSTFDFLDLYFRQFYEMKIRVVRFPLSDGKYECILTNLPQEEFSADNIKELYHMRWGIETSFRELKYSIGLTHFHSKKLDYIKQEIWARLILYNFCEAITTRAVIKQNNRRRKYLYQLNYTRAIHICRFFLTTRKEAPPDVEHLISQELLPVRPGRSDPRKVKVQSAVSFLYRVA